VLILGRFHAWQSSLVFAAAFVLHLVLSWSSFLSWVLFIADLGLICWLAFRAYKDGEDCLAFIYVRPTDIRFLAETLNRMELPYFGQIASRFVDQE